MAKTDNLKDYLKDLHEGIKTKKPDASRNPQDFRREIESIEAGVSLDPLTNPASSANVLIYKEAYDSNGNIITGTMPNQGTITDTIDGINNVSVIIPEGYVSGGTVSLTSDIQDEVDTQEDLIDEIISIVDSKMAGGGGDTEAYKSIVNCFMYPEEFCEIIIPSDMTTIGHGAFSEKSNITKVTIPDGVTYVGHNAFYGCSNLTTVNIPKSVTFMGRQVFGNCGNITKVTIDKDSPLTSLGQSLFYQSSIQSFQFPNNVTIIEDSTFYRCSSLETIIIPKSVKIISFDVFYGCDNLKNVYYTGTEEEWNAIDIAENSQSYLSNATITYNYVPTDE